MHDLESSQLKGLVLERWLIEGALNQGALINLLIPTAKKGDASSLRENALCQILTASTLTHNVNYNEYQVSKLAHPRFATV